MFHRPSNIDFVKNFHFKKIIFQNGSRWKWENTNPKMFHHRHKRGSRVVSSTKTRCVLSGRGLGTHRESFTHPHLSSYFFVCALLFYLGANGCKRHRIISCFFSIYRYLHVYTQKTEVWLWGFNTWWVSSFIMCVLLKCQITFECTTCVRVFKFRVIMCLISVCVHVCISFLCLCMCVFNFCVCT